MTSDYDRAATNLARAVRVFLMGGESPDDMRDSLREFDRVAFIHDEILEQERERAGLPEKQA